MVSFKRVPQIIAAVAVLGGFAALDRAAFAQEPAPTETVQQSQREQQLREQLKGILQELDDLQKGRENTLPPSERPKTVIEKVTPEQSQATGAMPEYELSDTSIVSTRVQKRPEGVSLSATLPSETDSQPTRTIKESMESLPGVVLRQANGPRDFSIMIRGQGAKTAFAVRDIKIYEDGIQQTQSDGLSRLDMQDPWFMRSVEVTRGASSSLYDNYAIGGMVQFRTRRGSDINGFESFLSGGSYGYHKEAFAIGQQFQNLDVALFASNVGEDGFIRNSDYKTQTLNFNLRFKIDDKQNFYFKAISNWLDTRVPTRLTQAQFNSDERQAGGSQTTCTPGTYSAGCANATLLHQQRIDRRTIVGGLYERQINADTILTLEADYDVKDINQYFSQITDNVNLNYKHYADLRHNGSLLGMPLKSYLGFFVNNMEQEGQTFQNLADGFGTRGTLLANNRVRINNIGGRFREELEFAPKWILAAGLGFEQSHISVQSINYNPATGAFASRASADRDFTNWAPEMSLSWKPAEAYRHWVRASTGYGIPQVGQLTRDPLTGLPGTNFNLKPQKNANFEIGTESKLHETLTVQLVGFWTFFKDEQITRAVSGTNTATVNADSSQYRGIEAFYDWRPMTGLRLSGAYTHIDAKYTNFSDQVNTAVGPLVRDGKNVPNVPTDVLNSKIAYDHWPTGWGAWVEGSYYNSYFLNNSNTFSIPSYVIANVNIHRIFELNNSWFRFAKFYVEVDNIADKKYAASGQVIGGETAAAAAGQQAFFAGYGRAFYGGVTLGLF
jgi:iron complex outermembrane receptor protein